MSRARDVASRLARASYATSSKPYVVLGGHGVARRATSRGDGGKNQTPGRRGWSTPARGALFVAASAYVAWTHLSASEEDDVERERATVENWSGTKRVE